MGNMIDELKKIPVWGWFAGAIVLVGAYLAYRSYANNQANAAANAAATPTTQDASGLQTDGGIDSTQMQGIVDMLTGIQQQDAALTSAVNSLGAATSIPGSGATYEQPSPTAIPAVAPGSLSVAALYQDLLGRAPDAAGAAYWGAKSPSSVFMGVSNSAEALAAAQANPGEFIQGEYESVLGRPADPAGYSTWYGVLAPGGAVTSQSLQAETTQFNSAASKEVQATGHVSAVTA